MKYFIMTLLLFLLVQCRNAQSDDFYLKEINWEEYLSSENNGADSLENIEIPAEKTGIFQDYSLAVSEIKQFSFQAQKDVSYRLEWKEKGNEGYNCNIQVSIFERDSQTPFFSLNDFTRSPSPILKVSEDQKVYIRIRGFNSMEKGNFALRILDTSKAFVGIEDIEIGEEKFGETIEGNIAEGIEKYYYFQGVKNQFYKITVSDSLNQPQYSSHVFLSGLREDKISAYFKNETTLSSPLIFQAVENEKIFIRFNSYLSGSFSIKIEKTFFEPVIQNDREITEPEINQNLQESLIPAQIKWYYFTLPAQTPYWVSWQDKEEGLENQTADIQVSIYTGDKETLYLSEKDNGYNTAVKIVFSEEKKIYLKVSGKYPASYGTYSLKIQKNTVKWNILNQTPAFSPVSGSVFLIKDGTLWKIGGNYNNEVWMSYDGLDWFYGGMFPFDLKNEFSLFIFQNKFWIAGGSTIDLSHSGTSEYKQEIWGSEDGINWSKAIEDGGFSGRTGQASVVFNEKAYLIGGAAGYDYKNDVWSSIDGIYWTLENNSAEFSGRKGHSVLNFNNKLWLIAGNVSEGYKNDVWVSENGRNWSRLTDSAAFQARAYHSTIVFDNKIWIIGGYDGSVYKNDVWYSTDGLEWIQANVQSDFESRSHFSSFIFNNKVCVAGGVSETGIKKDIWCME
ncbi:MAG: hypothetical protein A2Y41_02265 [Spirochaetes bacterium GWB1_36_13]|nr:MAG: hypothetical protein A2Y41_02265 [Spirochaetes bacterium GWB1_36_13]